MILETPAQSKVAVSTRDAEQKIWMMSVPNWIMSCQISVLLLVLKASYSFFKDNVQRYLTILTPLKDLKVPEKYVRACVRARYDYIWISAYHVI